MSIHRCYYCQTVTDDRLAPEQDGLLYCCYYCKNCGKFKCRDEITLTRYSYLLRECEPIEKTRKHWTGQTDLSDFTEDEVIRWNAIERIKENKKPINISPVFNYFRDRYIDPTVDVRHPR